MMTTRTTRGAHAQRVLGRQPVGRGWRTTDDEEIERAAFVAGDITDAEAVSRVVGEREITNVIHLAGLQVPTCRANPRLGIDQRRRMNHAGQFPRRGRMSEGESDAISAPPSSHFAVLRPSPAGNKSICGSFSRS